MWGVWGVVTCGGCIAGECLPVGFFIGFSLGFSLGPGFGVSVEFGVVISMCFLKRVAR